jgi:hypothetical protein
MPGKPDKALEKAVSKIVRKTRSRVAGVCRFNDRVIRACLAGALGAQPEAHPDRELRANGGVRLYGCCLEVSVRRHHFPDRKRE